MSKYLLIYHKEDNDGVFSGAIFYDYLINQCKIDPYDIRLYPADYQELDRFSKENSIDDIKENYENIIMTDISFSNSDFMLNLFNTYGSHFIWCDHHAPIIKESINKQFSDAEGVRNTSKSAILCAYEYLYDPFNEVYSTIDKEPNPKFPELFRILSGWDSWSYEREGYDFDYVRDINKGTTVTYNLDFNKILEVVHNIIQVYHTNKSSGELNGKYKDLSLILKLCTLGKQINEYDDQTMENIIKTSGDRSWNIVIHDEDKGRPLYLHACAIFHQGATNSTMFKSLKKTNISQGLVFKHCTNGNWVLSMYNVNDDHWLHCGDFLKERYNGGGHKGAAGCTLTEEQFINILKKKQL